MDSTATPGSTPTLTLDYVKSISKSQQPHQKESDHVNLESFQKKETILQNVETKLKEEFVGIDEQIERIISLIRPWYLIPSAIRKPIVIGLWGMTGVGKTSVVNRLAFHLDLGDRFVSEDLGNYSGDGTHLNHRIQYSSMPRLSGHQSIILLDELHNVRTIDQNGTELDRASMRDFWQLLDTGLITRDMERFQEMMMLLQTDMSYIPPGVDDPDKYLKERLDGTLSSYTLDKIIVQLELPIATTQLQKIVAIDSKAFASWLLEEYEWFQKNARMLDFRKSIIFVAGNLDEAFTDSYRVNPDDLTANELFDRTTQIGVDTVRECLLRRFRPEQVARLGSSLLVFPSLSRESILKLVQINLNKVSDFYKKEFDWTISFHDSVKEIAFKEGTIAAQGARIVLSMLSDMVESRVPKWLMSSMKKSVKSVSISFNENKKCFEVTDKSTKKIVFSDSVLLREDRLPEAKIGQALKNVLSIHEAGHAVAGVALYGMLPTKLFAGTTAWSRGGPRVVFPQLKLITREIILQETQVFLAGRAAEELAFGEGNLSDGCAHDIYMATQIVARMSQQLGMGAHIGYSLPDAQSPFSLSSFKSEDDKNTEKILKSSYKNVVDKLRQQWPLLMAISEALKASDRLTVLDFAKLVKEHYKGSAQEIEKIINRKEPKVFDSFSISSTPKKGTKAA